MSSLLRFMSDHWSWLVILACAGGAEWVAARFDAGITIIGRRLRRSVQRREQLRDLKAAAAKRNLDELYPWSLKPICGCGHDLAFHNVESNACHHADGDSQCACQCYTGPEPLGQVCLPPLIGSQRDMRWRSSE